LSEDEKGDMKITVSNRPMLEQKVREEKKAAEIISQCKDKTSLDAIAAATNQQVQQLDTVSLGASFIPNLGYEPKVVGYSFYDGLKPNSLSPGIKGMGGVYFILVLNRTKLPEDPQAGMRIAQERNQQEMQMKNAVGQQLQQTITKTADIKYYQANF
jgi:peptidyl-prolyl cis-trans isomerase D